jgi:hypothetical protein
VAVYKGNKRIVSYLMDKGADPLIRGPNKSTVLHVCAERGFSEIAYDIIMRDR